MSGNALTEAELDRYSRQFVLPQWSGEAQLALRRASVLVVGAGALGSPVSTYLAAAGVGRLGILDSDRVELSNLARQPLHATDDIGRPKAESAAEKLARLNPEAVVEAFPARLEEGNAALLIEGFGLVADCSDTFATRYTVNDACCAAGVPLVEGGVLGVEGLVLAIRPGESACYRCAFPTAPAPGSVPTCAQAGVLGPVAALVGSLMAVEAIKLLTGAWPPALGTLIRVDGATPALERVRVERAPACPACGPDLRPGSATV